MPLYERTSLGRRIRKGIAAPFTFRVRKKKVRGFAGWFKASGVDPWSFQKASFDSEKLGSPFLVSVLRFDEFVAFAPIVPAEQAVQKLDHFAANRAMWWIFLQSGCRIISANDFEKLIALALSPCAEFLEAPNI